MNELAGMRQRIAELEALETERMLAEEEIKQRNRELATFNAIATVVSQSLDPDEILNAGLDMVLELLHLNVGGIYLADPVRRKLDLIVHRGISKEFAHEIGSVSVDEKTVEAGMAEGKLRRFIFSVRAVTKDRVELKRIVSAMKKEGLSLASAVPVLLQAREEVLGLMIVASRMPRQYSEAELQLFTVIGQQIATSIENARLYQMAQRELAERKRAEEELRQVKEFNEGIVLGVAEAVVVEDAQGIITFINPAMEELVGYTGDELIGSDWRRVVPEEEIELVEAKVSQRPAGISDRYETRLLTKDGREIPVLVSARPLFEEGTFTGVLSAFTDITELKQAEEELREYAERLQEMVQERTRELRDAQEELVRQEKLATLGQLAGGVGHELRNPLGAISNAAYLLNMVLEDPDPEVKEALEILEKEVARSEKIINSLLDFARPKPPMRRQVDVNDVVQAALSRITVPQGVEVVSQLDEALPIILADPDQFGLVFGNLILNAIQAMPEGGELVVKSEVASAEWVAVSFSDTGVGIPEENLDKLFEPQFTTRAKGIGLGLALAKTLVEGHGGSIEVQSKVGKGTIFEVRLPILGGEVKLQPTTGGTQDERGA